MSRSRCVVLVVASVLILAGAVRASPALRPTGGRQTTTSPQTPERALYVRVCAECHDLERTESLRRSRNEWRDTIYQMIEEGAEASDAEYETILDFLATNFGAVAVNHAPADVLATVLAISEKDGETIVAYRTKHGNFRDFDALRKVPGLDVDKLEARRASLRFY
jgi:competence protein ComEA